MNNLPPFSKKLFSLQIRYAAIMSILALVMGLVYREISRPFYKGLTLEQESLYGHNMSLVHGHTFLLGAVIPLAMAVLAFLVMPYLNEKRLKNMLMRFKAYIIASAAALLLMIYKGLVFIMGAGQPLDVIDASLFFGSPILRGILFGLSHVVIFWAVGEIMAGIFIAASKMSRE